jgi:hypothetical protein
VCDQMVAVLVAGGARLAVQWVKARAAVFIGMLSGRRLAHHKRAKRLYGRLKQVLKTASGREAESGGACGCGSVGYKQRCAVRRAYGRESGRAVLPILSYRPSATRAA